MNPLRRRFRIFRQLRLTPFVECPHCHKLLEFKRRNCTVCREPIPPEYAMVSAVTNAVNTLACNEAKDIDHVATRIPIILATVFVAGILLEVQSIVFGLLVICAALQLIGVLSWNFRYRKFSPLGDIDFARAKYRVQRAARIWIAVSVLELGIVLAIRGK